MNEIWKKFCESFKRYRKTYTRTCLWRNVLSKKVWNSLTKPRFVLECFIKAKIPPSFFCTELLQISLPLFPLPSLHTQPKQQIWSRRFLRLSAQKRNKQDVMFMSLCCSLLRNIFPNNRCETIQKQCVHSTINETMRQHFVDKPEELRNICVPWPTNNFDCLSTFWCLIVRRLWFCFNKNVFHETDLVSEDDRKCHQ